MKQYPTVWTLEGLVRHCTEGGVQAGLPDGRWVPARPLGYSSFPRAIRAAWLVYTGKADAVIWPGQ